MAHTEENKIAVIDAVERAAADMRRGKAVIVTTGTSACLALNVEEASEEAIAELKKHSENTPALVITAARAQLLWEEATEPLEIALSESEETFADLIDTLSGKALENDAPSADLQARTSAASEAPVAALELAKIAELLPAVVAAPLTEAQATTMQQQGFLTIDAPALVQYRDAVAATLTRVSSAPLTLTHAPDTTIHVFRPTQGGKEHYALVIGDIKDTDAPLMRIHSSCYTGDLLASVKCDCRDQLQEAIRLIAESGGGIILYLMQEGRGIGLPNKLRAYALQRKGLDTVEANRFLGFEDDERPYALAATMLKDLGVPRVSLLTNNPRKVAALEQEGIEVKERVAHIIEPTDHTKAYLDTKFDRLGHLGNS